MEKRKSYEVMKSAIDKKFKPTPEEVKSVNSFFLVRYISNDPNSIYIANALNCNHVMPIEAQYNFVRNSTLDKVAFINYPKKDKMLKDADMKIIMSHFKISESVAKDYLKILGTEKTEEILNKYKSFGKKK